MVTGRECICVAHKVITIQLNTLSSHIQDYQSLQQNCFSYRRTDTATRLSLHLCIYPSDAHPQTSLAPSGAGARRQVHDGCGAGLRHVWAKQAQQAPGIFRPCGPPSARHVPSVRTSMSL
jgi:hypothetical protein